jgi:hypothetical protein
MIHSNGFSLPTFEEKNMRARKEFAFLLVFMLLFIAACGAQGEAGPIGPEGPQGEQGPAGPFAALEDVGCTDCHNETSLISGYQQQWSVSVHGTGEAFVRAGRASCAGCHSGGAFSEMIAAGLDPSQVETADAHPSRQDCRTCHEIHTTYTGDDFKLETVAAVDLYAVEGATYDAGSGNLCVNCHQPRRAFSEAVEGMVEVTSTHWGPHHGPQSAFLLGYGGAGLEGKASKHYNEVEDSCVGCHLGENQDHTFEPVIDSCTECHEDVESFDLNGLQTDVQAKLDKLAAYLESAGLFHDGHPVVGIYPEDQAMALWNYIAIAFEDKSLGIHNPSYISDLLEISLAVFE